MLTTGHRRTRLRYARNHRNWTARQWKNVLFIDESRFCLFENDASIRIWRRRRERFEANHIVPTRAYGGGSVMVWGGISMNHRIDLMILQPPVRYINEVLRPCVIPMRRRIGHDFILMQDNALPHVARVTREYLAVNNIQLLPYPSNSLDVNPIEHV